MARAIVTAIIGDKHRNLWERHARDSWMRYVARHGYELILIQQPIDPSNFGRSRHVAWQKLLLFQLPQVQRFERIAWVDCDILINDQAPDLFAGVPVEKIGAVHDQPLLSTPAMATVFQWLNPGHGTDAKSRAQVRASASGLPPNFDFIINTGVLVLSPNHRELLEHVYRNHRETPDSFMENMALCYEMLTRDLYFPLDPRFNLLWQEVKFGFYSFVRAFPALAPMCIANALSNCFFLHFAGFPDEMAVYDPAVLVYLNQVSFPVVLLDRLQENINRHRGR
jgi:hypothetical protein